MRALIVLIVLAATASIARAYPQFQLSKDQTCSDCHLNPAGGELLNENGMNTAQAMSWLGDDPGPFYGKVKPPDWLTIGGDLRGAYGYFGGPNASDVAFPMQADLYVNAQVKNFSLHITGGLEDPTYGDETATLFTTREHWLQWQQNEGSPDGLFIRVGRFMPVFGLRFDDHEVWTRRFGGTPLYGEAYGVAVEYIDPKWEVHATGFVHDPFFTSIERGNGAALYAEARLTEKTSIGVEGKLDVQPDEKMYYGGITAKQWLPTPGILLQFEGEAIHQKIDLGGHDDQLVGYLMGTYFLPYGIMIDLGVEAYEPNVHLRYLDEEGADLNIHWFATSHVELILDNHFQMLEFGEGGLSSGYVLLQGHYRI